MVANNELPKRSIWRRLLEIQATPGALAGGIAVGVFFGVVPVFGLKTVLTLGVAAALRCNPVAAVIALSAFDLFTPLIPVLMRAQYDLGYWILSNPHHLPAKLEMTHLHMGQWLHWTVLVRVGPPLLVGSLLMAVPATAGAFFVCRRLIQGHRARLARREHADTNSNT